MYGVLDGIRTALRQVQRSEFGINLFEVGDGRRHSSFQRLYRDDIFDAGTHRVSSEAFGIGDYDLVSRFSENVT